MITKNMITRSLPKTFAAALMVAVMGVAAAQTQAGAQPGPSLQQLHSDLQLNPSQEDAWNAFRQAYQVDPREIARQRQADSSVAGLTGPQRMDLAISTAERELDGLRRRGDALKAFYATLSPQQQKVFDRDTMQPQ